MKLILALAMILTTTTATASIEYSTFLPHEQKMIKHAVQTKCARVGTMSEMFTQVETVIIDNGIHDDYFTTNLELEVRKNKNISEIFNIQVKAARFSSYDHTYKVWGVFEVLSVNCASWGSGH